MCSWKDNDRSTMVAVYISISYNVCYNDIMVYQICDICGNKYTSSCRKCARRVTTWGVSGTLKLMELSKRNEDIMIEELLEFCMSYYIGKCVVISVKANILKTALRILGYKGKFIGRTHKNGTSYLSIRKRELSSGYRWRLRENNCNLCAAEDDLYLHHIIPISWGGITSKENCITLCKSCHELIHKKLAVRLNRSLLLAYLSPHAEEVKAIALSSLS